MSTKKERPVTIVEDDTPQEILAKSIVEVATAARRLIKGPLTMKAIEVLIQNLSSGVNRSQIRLVLENAALLDKVYLKSGGRR